MTQEQKQDFLRVLGNSLIEQLNGPMSLFARTLDSSEQSKIRIALQNSLEETLHTPEGTVFK